MSAALWRNLDGTDGFSRDAGRCSVGTFGHFIPMTFVAFAGPFLLGAGPLIVIFCVFIARKSFIVLLSLASAFYWLTVLLLLATVLRGVTPLPEKAYAHALAVTAGVIAEQVANVGLFKMKRIIEQLMAEVGRRNGHGFTAIDGLWLSFGLGFGHALTHATFFFVSVLEATSTGATSYDFKRCSQISTFVAMALSTLGLSLFHAFSTVVYFDGLTSKKFLEKCVPPAAHLILALLTIYNFQEDGCMVTIPLILATGCGFVLWTMILVWNESKRQFPIQSPENSRH